MTLDLNSLGFTSMPKVDAQNIGTKNILQAKDDNGNLYTKKEQIFDKNENLIQEIRYGKDGKETSIDYYEYDENGNNTVWYQDMDGDNFADTIYHYEYYDNNSLKSELIDTNANGKLDDAQDREYYHEIEYSDEEIAQMKQEAKQKEKERYESMNIFGKMFYNIGKGLSKLFFGE